MPIPDNTHSYSGVDRFNPPGQSLGSSLTLSNAHHGQLLVFTEACTVTIPAGLRPDFSMGWSQDGTGAITFEAGAGVTLQAFGGYTVSAGQYATGGMAMLDANIVRVYGNLTGS